MATTASSKVYVPIFIGRDDYLKVYQGSARHVFARDVNGRSVSFPANILQPFVTHNGIDGLFAIEINSAGKFISIERVTTR